jgi:hypothetical protein
MEDAHHTHKEVAVGWLAAVLDALVWSRGVSQDARAKAPGGRTAPTPLADGLHRLSSPH